ncbi:MAG: type II secretion system protein [Gammaproteobacteria bacterium]
MRICEQSTNIKPIGRHVQQGMTLIELSVVLLILIALAGIAIPYIGSTSRTAMCQATDATMHAVREAIMGGAAGPGFYSDTLGYFPKDSKDASDYSLHHLFHKPTGWEEYNPKTGVGWRGPYLQTGGLLSSANLHNSFSDVGTSGKVHIDHNVSTLTHVFDAWHRPIVIQIPYYDDDGSGPNTADYHLEYARLVSAGPGAGIEPNAAEINTPINEYDANSRADDRVLYFRVPDPKAGGNAACAD